MWSKGSKLILNPVIHDKSKKEDGLARNIKNTHVYTVNCRRTLDLVNKRS